MFIDHRYLVPLIRSSIQTLPFTKSYSHVENSIILISKAVTRFLFRSNAAPVTATGIAVIYFHGRVHALLFSHGFATLESFYPLFRRKNGQAARKYSGSLPRAFPFTLSRSYVFVRARRGHTNRAEDVRPFGDASFVPGRSREVARLFCGQGEVEIDTEIPLRAQL